MVKLTAAQRDRARKAAERAAAAASSGAASPLFASRFSASGRPALPLELFHLIVDRLPVRDVVQSLAVVSVGGYQIVREYAENVQQRAATADLDQFGVASDGAACSRTDACTFSSAAGVISLLRSRLRGLVTGVVLPVRSSSLPIPFRPLDVTLVSRLALALPELRHLQCELSASTDGPTWTITLPSRIRSLALHAMRFGGRLSYAGYPRLTPASLVSEGWPQSSCLAFSVAVTEAVARLPHLTHLAFEPAAFEPAPAFAPLAACSRLRSLASGTWSKDTIAHIRSLPHLTAFKPGITTFPGDEVSGVVELLRPPQTQPLASVELQFFSFVDAMREPFIRLRASLTELTPPSWRIVDLMWLTQFPLLQTLRFADQVAAGPYVSPSPESAVAPITSVACVVSLLTHHSMSLQLRSLVLRYADCTDDQLELVLSSLRTLHTLRLESTAITRLQVLSRSCASSATLRSLHLTLPAVPPAEAHHLCNLRQLTSLNIAGSFNDVLTIDQLMPFLPPYPRMPMQCLRTFTPRSDREPARFAGRRPTRDDCAGPFLALPGSCLTSALPPILLSVVLSFLSLVDFLVCGRSCRVLRSAAALPSGWSFTPGAASTSASDALALGVCLGPLLPEVSLPACGRRLSLTVVDGARTVECLTHMPLLRHAPWLSLHPSAGHSFGLAATQRDTFDALSECMPRMRGLDANLGLLRVVGTAYESPTPEIDRLFERIGSRLRRAHLQHCSAQILATLRNVVDLGFSVQGHWFKGDDAERFEAALSSMHALRRLTLDAYTFPRPLVSAVRLLSVQHVLSEFRVQLSGPQSGPDLTEFAALAGQAVGSAVSQLETLSVHSNCPAGHLRQLEPLFQLPRLRRLAICSSVREAWNPAAALASVTAPLESLHLVADLSPPALLAIASLGALQELRLGTAVYVDPPGVSPAIQLPEACLQQWVLAVPMLRVLSLDNIQLHSSDDLQHLSCWSRLHSLALARQRWMRMADLTAVLPRLQNLRSLLLQYNHNIFLCARDWMQKRGGPRGEEDVSSSAATALAGALHAPAPAAGLLDALKHCRFLRSLSWAPLFSVLAASAAYTSAHSWMPPKLRAHSAVHFNLTEAARERESLRRFVREVRTDSSTRQLHVEVATPGPPPQPDFTPLHVAPLSVSECLSSRLQPDPCGRVSRVSPLSLARADAVRMATERMEEESWELQARQQAPAQA